MMKIKFSRWPRFFALSLILSSFSLQAENWTIGVLALRGPVSTQIHWQGLVDTLNKALPNEDFTLLPLNLDEMREAVQTGQIDFLLTNPAQLIQLVNSYDLRWLLSLRSSLEPDNRTRNVLGSLILVKNDDQIKNLDDLIGKKVGAISADAFGGYLLGYKVLRDKGYEPTKDFRMQFLGFPADALIYALRDGGLSAAIVPVCLLENMSAEGLINKQQFRPLIEYPSSLPCLTSTELYPNWSFAALGDVPNDLVDRVTKTLLNTETSGLSWGAPSSISQVDTLLRSINKHPQQRQFWRDIVSWAIQYQLAIGIVVLVFVLLGVNHIWIAFLVRRRSQQLDQAYNLLRQQETDLDKAQRMNILGEMASGFAHELNQPLSAIRHYAQGSVIRLKQESELHSLLPTLEKIDQQAQRGADIIRNLRLWVGKSHLDNNIHYTSQSVTQIILHLWQLLRITQHYPSVQLFLPPNQDNHLMLPETLLEQLLSNLLTNSLQADAQQIRIEFHTSTKHFLLVFQDDAGGMTEEQLTAGITPFSTTKQEGLGLGLVICQRLMQSQKGDIRIENHAFDDKKIGLRVTLIFPKNLLNNNPLDKNGEEEH